MVFSQEERRHFDAGSYICPITQAEVHMESDVPRAWVVWPARVKCKACGGEHVLEYSDVLHEAPLFGHE